ncbi:MAG: hypothetical protein Q9N62_07115 [Ghiorsea sp.]|nr:hypothetical protein [Ghiorsea sp.]
MHLICKLRYNSQLYLPWQGEYSGRGRKRIYGERLLPQKISNEYRVHETCEDGVLTEYFQIEARHKKFPDALNVVIITIPSPVLENTLVKNPSVCNTLI